MTTVTSGPSSRDDYRSLLKQLIRRLSLSLGLLYTHAGITQLQTHAWTHYQKDWCSQMAESL